MSDAPTQSRRSDRVLIRIPIEVIGRDSSGHKFSAGGITHSVNSHGGMIVVHSSLAAGQQIRLRRPTGMAAEIRVVGQVGIGEEGNFYGIAFLDSEPDFWGIRFPSATDPDSVAKVLLECDQCACREIAQLDPIQLDVFRANDSLARPCSTCGELRIWKPALFEAPARRDHRAEDANAQPAPSSQAPEPVPAVAPSNRRKSYRLQVKMKACVPPPDGFGRDDVVQVLDLSKGGLRFRSARNYVAGQWVHIAVPYTPGAANIFTQGRIAWRSKSSGDFSEYGVKYVKLVC